MPTNHCLGPCALAAWMVFAVPCGVAWAQAPTTEIPAAPRFDITRFDVVGNTLLKPGETPMGREEERSEINRVTERIITCVYRVINTLGSGFLEKVYARSSALF